MATVRAVSGSVSTFRLFFQRPRVPFVSPSPAAWVGGFYHHRRMSSQRPLEPRIFPSSGFDLIDPSILVEEESIPNYKPQRFYPVRIGQVFKQRYQVVGKLGYGASSTVWLCRDLVGHDYITLKVYVNSLRTHRELPIYERLDKIQSDHAGRQCLRKLLDSFEVTGPNGKHICLIHQPLGMSLYELKMRARGKVFSKDVLRPAIRQLLAAVDYLHKEAHIIHTDLQPNNILMGIDDTSVLTKYENDELEHPVPRKVEDDRIIYLSRPIPFTFGPPVLCDLGDARLGDERHQDDIMPDVYRAPEVIIGMNWGYKVDIWNVAMVVWDLFEPDHLFKARNCEGEYDDAYHLAQMVAVLGQPPLDFLKRSPNCLKYWDENGNWTGLATIPDLSLERLEQRLAGDDQEMFLNFIRQMLCWIPEERPTAEEAIFDPWLMQGLFDNSDD